jgi:hypothetical protein
LILIDTALVTGLHTLAAGAKDLRRDIHLHVRANAVNLRASVNINENAAIT